MKRAVPFAAAGLALLLAGHADAQAVIPVTLEGRGVFAIPTGTLADDADVDNGVGFGLTASLRLIPGINVYGGWQRVAFGAGDLGLGGAVEGDLNLVDSGFSAGGQLSLPVGLMLGFTPWVRGGVVFHELEYDYDGDLEDVIGDMKSDRSTGFEVGAGADIPLGFVLSFVPQVTYRTYDPSFGDDGTVEDTEDALSYVEVGVGLKYKF